MKILMTAVQTFFFVCIRVIDNTYSWLWTGRFFKAILLSLDFLRNSRDIKKKIYPRKFLRFSQIFSLAKTTGIPYAKPCPNKAVLVLR